MDDAEEHVSDVDLIERLRQGDRDASVELWTRHYPSVLLAARRVTRQPRDAEEVASDAFSGMLSAVASGAGPSTSVRAYLVTSVRNLASSRATRASSTEILTDDVAVFDQPTRDTTAHMSELELVRVAFAALPRRWQIVLWRTAVDRDSNIEVGRAMDLSPNGVAALAKRARRGFRLSYLRAHLSDRGVSKECEPFIDGLADLTVAGSATSAGVAEHVATCPKCTDRLAELRSVDRHFAGLLGPAILGLIPAHVLTGAGSASAPMIGSILSESSARLMAKAGTKWAFASLGAVGATTVAVAIAFGAGTDAPVATPAAGRASTTAPASRTPSTAPSVIPLITATSAAPEPSGTPGPRPAARTSPSPGPSTRTDTPAPSRTGTPAPSRTSSNAPVPTRSGSPTPTPTPTDAVPITPMTVQLAVRGPRRDTAIDVSASADGIKGPVRLTLEVPEGVMLVSTDGAWDSCSQSGRFVTCFASTEGSTTWAGTIDTVWFPSSKGPVRATVTGTYADGSAASGSVETTWPL